MNNIKIWKLIKNNIGVHIRFNFLSLWLTILDCLGTIIAKIFRFILNFFLVFLTIICHMIIKYILEKVKIKSCLKNFHIYIKIY